MSRKDGLELDRIICYDCGAQTAVGACEECGQALCADCWEAEEEYMDDTIDFRHPENCTEKQPKRRRR